MPLVTEQLQPLQPFLHRRVILDNLRDMFGLLSEFRDEPATTEKEQQQIGALARLHCAVLQVTGQQRGDRDDKTKNLLDGLNAAEVDSQTAAQALSELDFKAHPGEMEWPTILTTGEVGQLSAVFEHHPWEEPCGRIVRFSIFADDARW